MAGGPANEGCADHLRPSELRSVLKNARNFIDLRNRRPGAALGRVDRPPQQKSQAPIPH
jgi:hypothetical protein